MHDNTLRTRGFIAPVPRFVAFGTLALLVGCASGGAPVATTAPSTTSPAAGGQPTTSGDYLPLRYDAATGKVFLTIPRMNEELLYLNTLATGLGMAALDRGQVGTDAVVRFERHGARVFLIRDNTEYRAVGADAAERRAVEEAFPRSVLASFAVQGEGTAGTVIDATDFFLTDMYDVVGRLRGARLGTLRVDRERSYVDPANTRSFPVNTEVRSVISYVTDDPAPELRRLAADGRSISLQQHHSFLRLPEQGLAMRRFDPRTGINTISFFDFAQPFDSDYRQRTIARWRLEPRDPAAYQRGELTEPIRPIVYYLDRAVPEPYRSAFIEGGNWWNEVFEAAGWRNAFRVEMLPEGIDPLDARYPVIYWVHRRERGPSVGPSLQDPRTGEILTTVVRMDSYRSLVDHDIYMGLVPAAGAGGLQMSPLDFAMARRRQHAAHEIGHTLGLAHNFMAASQSRASVMDYPYPLIRLNDQGQIDVTEAYRTSGGAHDTLAIRYAYTWYPNAAAEAEGLSRLAREAEASGLRFITGGHTAQEGSYPAVTQWLEGNDMMEALQRTSSVRRVLIERFDERAAQPGEPLAVLNRRFAHVYLHHRYALEAVTKFVGGMEFGYAIRGEATEPTRVLPPEEQRRALRMVLDHLQPAQLRIPDRVARIIPPVPYGYDNDLTLIPTPAGTAFDPVGTAHSLAQEIVDNLLHPERMARVVSFHARNAASPSLEEVLSALVNATWGTGAATSPDPQDAALRRVAQRATLDGLIDLAADRATTAQVRAGAEHQLTLLRDRLSARPAGASAADLGHRSTARRDIERYFEGNDDPAQRPRPARIALPWP